jgi:urea carboxylase
MKQLVSTLMTVHVAGVQSTVQDVRGRTGLWDVGVPPSGAFDELSAELGARAVGNPLSAAAIECVVLGPSVSFDRPVLVCITGAAHSATVDGEPLPPGQVRLVPAAAIVAVGPIDGLGMRAYLSVGGGLDCAVVLGSRSAFVLGGFGGVQGRALIAGDVIPVGRAENLTAPMDVVSAMPILAHDWSVRVILGPHGAPEHLTEEGIAQLLSAVWLVDHRADRTGVRLVGPTPLWARADGGEAGLHPSNVHDSAYPVGGIMLSGDTPVIVGKDGPSLGGFVVPAVIIGADRWMVGQLRPGDTVRLVAVSPAQADAAIAAQRHKLTDLPNWMGAAFQHAQAEHAVSAPADRPGAGPVSGPALAVGPSLVVGPLRPDVLHQGQSAANSPAFTIRRCGDRHLLVEAGPSELDLTVRMWIHLLAEALRADRPAGIVEIVEGVRSVLVAVDDSVLSLGRLGAHLGALAISLPDPATVTLEVREVTMPIAFDHPEAHEAMRRYAATVRPDAPWSPDNVEFIRRVNDLEQRADVFDIVQAATYLVVGLGDVYLGAPVAVPIDPRHRLVTTKYNPARTWTPQNAVGIGGIYLCVYGMEGPGGYQLVGRTVPVWRLSDRDPQPWLLRQFDRLRFTPVSVAELTDLRADIKAGRADLQMRPATFSIREVAALSQQHSTDIAALRQRRRAAFDAERERWTA